VLVRWQAVAMMAANPLSDEEREQIEHARTGDFSGLLSWDQGHNGSWVRLWILRYKPKSVMGADRQYANLPEVRRFRLGLKR
jgi:hypothetical protein